jgi:hypothetical protein
MMLPAAAARFWMRELWTLSATRSALTFASRFLGLLLSYHLDLPSGPSIVLVAGLAYFASVLFGPRDSLRTLYLHRRQREAGDFFKNYKRIGVTRLRGMVNNTSLSSRVCPEAASPSI